MPHDGTPRRPRTLTFDARSVLLFAALSMGGAALQAQTSSSSAQGSSSSSSSSSSTSLPSLRLQAPGSGGVPSGTGLRASGGTAGVSSASASSASRIAGNGSHGDAGAGSTHTAQADVHAAFRRADKNQDGQLSPAEASAFPAIGNRFKELDKDRNGSLSPEEFQAGASS